MGAPDDSTVGNAAVVHRAVAYIEAHPQATIGVSDIAVAARVSPRTLQLAFRHQLHTTPMAHLREVRLHRAHSDLYSADPALGVTVLDIALRWGFGHQGRFAAHYRRTFGCVPTTTLRG